MLDCTSELQLHNKPIEDGQIEEVKEFFDEAEAFHYDPIGWLRENWINKNLNESDIIVVYEKTFKRIKPFLHGKFKYVTAIFNSHFLNSLRQDHRIIIVKKLI